MQLHWAPPDRRARARPILEAQRGFPRFLAISTAVHALGGAALVWLSVSLLPARPDDGALVRTIDFAEPPGPPARATRPDRAGTEGTTVAAAASRPVARAAAPARSLASARAKPDAVRPAAAPTPAPAVSEPADARAPTSPAPPSPDDTQLAAATPKSVGRPGTPRLPSSIAAPASGAREGASATSGEPGSGPVGTVALPSTLARPGAAGGRPAGAIGAGAIGAGGIGAGAAVDLGDPDFSEYFGVIERRVRTAWKFPESLGGTTQTVKIGFALNPEGSLREVRVVSSSAGTLNDSALTAMRRAAPFPPLPEKFRGLAGQPLVMSFTVTIR